MVHVGSTGQGNTRNQGSGDDETYESHMDQRSTHRAVASSDRGRARERSRARRPTPRMVRHRGSRGAETGPRWVATSFRRPNAGRAVAVSVSELSEDRNVAGRRGRADSPNRGSIARSYIVHVIGRSGSRGAESHSQRPRAGRRVSGPTKVLDSRDGRDGEIRRAAAAPSVVIASRPANASRSSGRR